MVYYPFHNGQIWLIVSLKFFTFACVKNSIVTFLFYNDFVNFVCQGYAGS